MRVLVAAASRHGTTLEIATVIAGSLSKAGFHAVVLPADRVGSLDGYEAVVLGSAVYAGHWLDPAKHLVERNAAALATLPVWLFSSGPVGDPAKPEVEPVDVPALMQLSGARGHRTFAGKIDKHDLNLGEKLILAMVHVPDGDYRSTTDIQAWAAEIAEALQPVAVA